MTKQIMGILGVMGTLFLLAAFAQKPEPTQQLAVYDADGKKVGVISGGGGNFYPLVPFKIDGIPFMLYSLRDGFISEDYVGWTSTDCTGTPYVWLYPSSSGYSPSSIPAFAAGPPGDTVYIQDGQAETVTIHSTSNGPSLLPSQPAECKDIDPFTGPQLWAPARPLVDMTTLYQPPFTVR